MFSLGVAGMACGADALAEGFADPPAESRPRTWWHWMDNNISRAGITKDLEAMGPTSKIRSDLILEVFVAFPLASPCARRAEDVAPYHNNMFAIMWHLVFPCTLVGADVPGGPRPRWRLRWRPRVRGAPGRRALP